MLEYELLHFRPSQVASAATLLAKMYMNDDTRSLRCAAATKPKPAGQRHCPAGHVCMPEGSWLVSKDIHCMCAVPCTSQPQARC